MKRQRMRYGMPCVNTQKKHKSCTAVYEYTHQAPGIPEIWQEDTVEQTEKMEEENNIN